MEFEQPFIAAIAEDSIIGLAAIVAEVQRTSDMWKVYLLVFAVSILNLSGIQEVPGVAEQLLARVEKMCEGMKVRQVAPWLEHRFTSTWSHLILPRLEASKSKNATL